MPMFECNLYRQQVVAGVGGPAKLSPETDPVLTELGQDLASPVGRIVTAIQEGI